MVQKKKKKKRTEVSRICVLFVFYGVFMCFMGLRGSFIKNLCSVFVVCVGILVLSTTLVGESSISFV